MKNSIIVLALLFCCLNVVAQIKVVPIQVCPSDLLWSPTKPPLAPGAEMTVLEGNPKDSGHFTMRVKMPPYYILAPHTHPADERTTVITGSVSIGLGEKIDSSKTKVMTPGCFYVNPKGAVHYLINGNAEAIVQISTNGPWGFKFEGKK